MLLLGDSGSTKTDWRLIQGNTILQQLESPGLNPNFHSSESISNAMKVMKLPEDCQLDEIILYAAGCSSLEKRDFLNQAILKVFPKANVQVEHDLLGAARAACGKRPGLAGILGTGSNCCYYDGKTILRSFRSGGYSIGDEGGGVDIGRRVLKAWIEGNLPEELIKAFDQRYKISYDEILQALYKEDFPNRFMAKFSQFGFHHKAHPFIQAIILKSFDAYFKVQVLRHPEAKKLDLNLIGSVAFYYEDILRNVAEKHGVRIGTILEKPIAGMALYHSEGE